MFYLHYYILRGAFSCQEWLGHTLYSAAKLQIFPERNGYGDCLLDEVRGINDEIRGLLFEEDLLQLYTQVSEVILNHRV